MTRNNGDCPKSTQMTQMIQIFTEDTYQKFRYIFDCQQYKNLRISVVSVSSVCKIILFLLYLASATLTAQEVKLNYNDPKNKQTIQASLYDSYNGDFLMYLPLTFHITQDYILFMIIGDETGFRGSTGIYLFDQTMELKEVEKRNRNLEISEKFKKHYKRVSPFFEWTANLEMLSPFQNNCEYIENTPKPLFFQIKNTPNAIELKLRFYIADLSDNDKYIQKLIAESGIVKTTINIIK